MFSKLNNVELKAIKLIRNNLVHRGTMPSMRELMREMQYKSPRSISVIFQSLIEKGILKRREKGGYQLLDFQIEEEFGTREQTIMIPLLGEIACGLPIFAQENIEAEIPVSVRMIKMGYKYFLLKAIGDSMNLAGIKNGDLLLIRQQASAENGNIVVALVDDEATIKVFQKEGSIIILKPKSDNSKHQPIILTNDFKIQGIVENVIPL